MTQYLLHSLLDSFKKDLKEVPVSFSHKNPAIFPEILVMKEIELAFYKSESLMASAPVVLWNYTHDRLKSC